MIPLIIIRPEPGCSATLAAARDQGLEAHGFPLSEVKPAAWQPPDPASIDALLLGSVNALRHGGSALSAYRGKPAYAVGRATAEAAEAAGFGPVDHGAAGLQSMFAKLRPGHHRLLRLAGEARVDLVPPAGITIIERIVYRDERREMLPALADRLQAPAVILLHSGEAARHFAALCHRHSIDRSLLSLATIGPRVAEAAGEGWHVVASAEAPNDAALLALAREMCQKPAGSGNLQDRA